jgi:DNA replication and repair protein RecF
LLDTIISQVDADYLGQLIQYNRVMQQRNSLLKQFAESGRMDHALLSVLDDQLVAPAGIIYKQRMAFLEQFIPEVGAMYALISGSAESVSLEYQSQLQDKDMAQLLRSSLEKDRYAQRTTAGIHRDELDMKLEGQPFKQVASQGQRKSLLFAIRLAEFNVLKRYKGYPPLLLLDDVFEKLDADRMHNLLDWACVRNDGQVFLTDTHCTRLTEALEKLNVPAQIEQLG